jgi:tRNA A37 threonylcarbamoyltransferase TsaD
MIAQAGLWRLKNGEREGLPIRARARWPLDAIGGATAISAGSIA